ncbi:Metacaspase-5 [Lasiodiplodia theobromae]|uniref:Metacaspase-5 n=1 Tax=Lasiodiplodia theobromae TaxID=45133 RepID=A0A5N5CTK0_9PEZI|nr:Metacaspase-5 [Lasiodiplodia theobromae]
METKTPTRKKWAILVGINEYSTGDKRVDKDGNRIHFGNLRGCLNDIDRLEQHLLGVQEVQKDHIFRLCSPLQPTDHSSSVQEPTAENIKNKLNDCTIKAKPGDIVYFHYSGHGARVKTRWRELKGENGIDECLVPFDVPAGGAFLRDFELESILNNMTNKGLLVTVTLDSCHSGGAFERGDPSVLARGIEGIVENLETDQPLTNLDRSDPLFQRYSGAQPRDDEREAWILKPQDYALLAACGPHEKAYEADEQGVYYGTFTHWLLETIKSDSHSTHRTICDRVSIKVRNRHPGFQSPVAAGALDRNFMDSGSLLGIRSFKLFGLPNEIKKGERATMDAGKAHGVCKEDEYAIYPWNVRNMSDSQELAVVRVVEVEDLESEAEFTKVNTLSVSEIETGCRAVRIRRQDCIQVMITDEKLHSEFASAMEKFKDGSFPLQLIINEEERSGDSNAFYQVSLSATGEYRLLSGLGEVIPFLPVSRSPTTILQQAVHLGVFETIRGLKNESKSEGLSVMENQFEFSADIEVEAV